MKYFISVIAIAISMFGLTGCGSSVERPVEHIEFPRYIVVNYDDGNEMRTFLNKDLEEIDFDYDSYGYLLTEIGYIIN